MQDLTLTALERPKFFARLKQWHLLHDWKMDDSTDCGYNEKCQREGCHAVREIVVDGG